MAAFVGLWAGMNYEQLTSLFRVEERSIALRLGQPGEHPRSRSASTLLLVVALDQGPIGVIVGNFTGTLLVYVALVGYRREQLGLQFDRSLLREMNRFGVPLDPDGALSLDHELQRPALPRPARGHDRGRPLFGRRAHRLGDGAPADRVPARLARVRLLDRGRAEARRTYAFVLTYLVLLTTWVATGARAPLAVDRRLDRRPGVRGVVARRRAARVRGRRLRRVHRRRDRRRPRAANAVQLGGDRSRRRGERRAQPDPDPAATG